MQISDEMIDSYLQGLFGRSKPGASMHHLWVASAGPDTRSPLGVTEPGKVEAAVYAIAPTGDVNADAFVGQVVMAAVVEAMKQHRTILWAGLATEVAMVVAKPDDEVQENRARRLHADGNLIEHPDAGEMTLRYAACRDGRRWTGRHMLTGPEAGTITGPDLRTGPMSRDEMRPHARLVRKAVGLGGVPVPGAHQR